MELRNPNMERKCGQNTESHGSSSNHKSYVGNIVICNFGEQCPVKIVRTKQNVGQRFYGRPKCQDDDGGCGYFEWINPLILDRAYNSKEKEQSFEMESPSTEADLIRSKALIKRFKVENKMNRKDRCR